MTELVIPQKTRIHTIVSKLALESGIPEHVLYDDRSAVDDNVCVYVDRGLSPTVTVYVQLAPGVRTLCR